MTKYDDLTCTCIFCQIAIETWNAMAIKLVQETGRCIIYDHWRPDGNNVTVQIPAITLQQRNEISFQNTMCTEQFITAAVSFLSMFSCLWPCAGGPTQAITIITITIKGKSHPILTTVFYVYRRIHRHMCQWQPNSPQHVLVLLYIPEENLPSENSSMDSLPLLFLPYTATGKSCCIFSFLVSLLITHFKLQLLSQSYNISQLNKITKTSSFNKVKTLRHFPVLDCKFIKNKFAF